MNKIPKIPVAAWDSSKNYKEFVKAQKTCAQVTEDTSLRHCLSLGAIASLTFAELQISDEVEITQFDFLTELKIEDRDYLLQQGILSVIRECAGMSLKEYREVANNHIAYYNKAFVGEFYGRMGLTLKESLRCISQYFYHRNLLKALSV